MELEIIHEWENMIKNSMSGAVATIVSSEGSVPRHLGTRMIVKSDKSITGTIGGGVLENQVINDAIEVIESQKALLKEYKLSPAELKGIGMTCGGRVQIFIEPVYSMNRMLIIGAGHIAVALVPLAKKLGFHVTVVEDRKEMLIEERFAGIDLVKHVDANQIDSFIKSIKLEYIVMVNRHGGCDVDWLKAILSKNEAKYVGCIGSRLRSKTTFDELMNQGISNDLLNKIHTPIGIEIGAETPEEIAVSIMAEVIATRHNVNKQR